MHGHSNCFHFWLLWIMLLWTFVYKFLSEWHFHFWGYIVGVELLDHYKYCFNRIISTRHFICYNSFKTVLVGWKKAELQVFQNTWFLSGLRSAWRIYSRRICQRKPSSYGVIPLMSTLSDEDLWQALEAPAYVSPPQNFGCHGVIESEDCHP